MRGPPKHGYDERAMRYIGAPMRKVLLALLILASTVGSASAADGPNLLANPSFEGGVYHASMSNFIPEGWGYWFQHRNPGEERLYWMPEPEFGLIVDRPGQAVSGSKSARWFNIWAIHNAGLYQRVQVPENALVQFTIWVLSWSADGDTFLQSESWHHRAVGIDPTGGTDPFSREIVWGDDDSTMDRWTQLSTTATARGRFVTVFVREQPDWPVKHNDCLVDDAALRVLSLPESLPPPAAAQPQEPTPAPKPGGLRRLA
jgi:hypothetical protein